jgi:serine/threonine-protein kinase RsbW
MEMVHKLAVHCDKTRLHDIREFVKNKLSNHVEMTEAELLKVIVAVDEICANMMIHANDCNPQMSIEIELNIEENKGITFKIIDKGLQFNYHNYHEPSLDEIVKEKRKGGLGMKIVKQVMDRIEFLNDSHQNTCILYRSLEKEKNQ